MIREANKIHQDDIGHIPLHQQALAWGMKKNLDPRPAPVERHLREVDGAEVIDFR